MAKPTSSAVVSNMSEILSFVSERGILSSLYLGAVFFGLVAGSMRSAIEPDTCLWIALTCSLLGLIGSNATYELLRLPIGWLTRPIILRSFNRTVQGHSQLKFARYSQIRRFRESFLASGGLEHFKLSIRKEMRLGQMLAYLVCSSILALIVVHLASRKLGVLEVVTDLELWVVSYVLVASALGGIARCATEGRTIGLAYLSEQHRAESEARRHVEHKNGQHRGNELG